MSESIWGELNLKEFPTLNQDINTDVLVIGGGICGILCAHQLQKENKEVVLLEANRIGRMRTHNTTAVATALQDVMYSDLIKNYNTNIARDYLNANLVAIAEFKKLSLEYDFDFEEVSSYKYFTNKMEYELERLALSSIHAEYHTLKNIPFKKDCVGAIEFKNQAQFHPLKLIQKLSENLKIYENTTVLKIKNNIAYTEKYKIKANHIICATGFPLWKLKSLFSIKLRQKMSYVAVTNQLNYLGNGIGNKTNDLYYRTYGDKLIIGGYDHLVGVDNNNFHKFKEEVKHNFGQIDKCWFNIDTVSLDEMYYIGRISKRANLYVGTGFNLWGMTGSMLSSMIISDLIMKRPNKYVSLFNPSRRKPLKPLLKNILNAVINMLPLRKRCSHLGCALSYDKEIGCYVCPCHGTIYNEEGNILYNPANKEINK